MTDPKDTKEKKPSNNSVKIIKTQLDRKNVKDFKTIFKASFPDDSWRMSVPFRKDDIYAAVVDRKIVGFAMVHDTTPYPFKTGDGSFAYNLCVDPDHRCRGIATAIVNAILEDHKFCHTQTFQNNITLCDWFAKRGWIRVGTFRDLYAEFSFGFSDVNAEKNTSTTASKYYDPLENIIYLN